jgi:hypothetical protein
MTSDNQCEQTAPRAAHSDAALPQPDDLRFVYQQLCESYRAIDDSRLKLLSLLPLATGAGILVLSGRDDTVMDKGLSLAVGLFGVMATFGLYCYELHGSLIEERLKIHGQFGRRPQEVAGFIDEPFSASIIYSVSLAGWVFFAFRWVDKWWVALFSVSAFIFGFLLSIWLIRRIEYDLRKRMQYGEEPLLFRRELRAIKDPKTTLKHKDRRGRLPEDATRSPVCSK